jgi:hypothetical protein
LLDQVFWTCMATRESPDTTSIGRCKLYFAQNVFDQRVFSQSLLNVKRHCLLQKLAELDHERTMLWRARAELEHDRLNFQEDMYVAFFCFWDSMDDEITRPTT